MVKMAISLGGSLLNPEPGKPPYASSFANTIINICAPLDQFLIVTGGGKLARDRIAKAVEDKPYITDYKKDLIGIEATVSNAKELHKHFVGCTDFSVYEHIIRNPAKVIKAHYMVAIGAGHIPGSSTDYVATRWALSNGIYEVINLTNTDYVYDKDPNTHSDAKPIERITWADFRKMNGEKWTPGMHSPFDPVASQFAERNGMNVIIANGRNLNNLIDIILGRQYVGTTISN